MGQCYSVTLCVTIKKDRQKDAAEALNTFMRTRHEQDRANFGLPERAAGEGLYPVGVIDSLALVFSGAGRGFTLSSFIEDGLQTIRLESDFNASYGWMGVMEDAFKELVPFLEDDSEAEIWGDSDGSRSVIENGRLAYYPLGEENEEDAEDIS